jgi:hypothetical protein
VALEDRAAGHASQVLLDTGAGVARDGVGARLHLAHVDPDAAVQDDPVVAARRARCAAYALATSVLVGMQPVLTQVPPNSLRSTNATVMPPGQASGK